ncbi:hypothetical protein AA313_de0208583 [Arthrobotrys entomopaga]|nr:hypothetical protein AA313_de0208583 [Arthrobotrys entomopaga]
MVHRGSPKAAHIRHSSDLLSKNTMHNGIRMEDVRPKQLLVVSVTSYIRAQAIRCRIVQHHIELRVGVHEEGIHTGMRVFKIRNIRLQFGVPRGYNRFLLRRPTGIGCDQWRSVHRWDVEE